MILGLTSIKYCWFTPPTLPCVLCTYYETWLNLTFPMFNKMINTSCPKIIDLQIYKFSLQSNPITINSRPAFIQYQ